ERVGEYEVPNGRAVSHDEFSTAHVLFQHLRHGHKIVAGKRQFAGQPLVLRIKAMYGGQCAIAAARARSSWIGAIGSFELVHTGRSGSAPCRGTSRPDREQSPRIP